jgi:hypothetical protein
VTVKLRTADVPPPGVGVNTVTGTEPWIARSAAVIVARSWLALTKVVVRLAPFQRTTDVAAKPLPFTVRMKPVLPAAALTGERLLTTGTGEFSGWLIPVVLNVAVTVVAALIVQEQVAAVPPQAPLQPANVEPDAAVAVSVTGVPTASAAVQLVPQVIPVGELVTVPPPVPFFVTVSATAATAVDAPLTAREIVSPLAVKLTLPAKVPTVVGRNRTLTT